MSAILTPTPSSSGRPQRRDPFATLAEGLDFAAGGATGVNIHGQRGELSEVLTWARLRDEARALARGLLALGLEQGDRVALVASSDGDFLRGFFACQYAGLTPAPLPLPAPFGGKDAWIAHTARLLRAVGARAVFGPPEFVAWIAEATRGLDLLVEGVIGDVPESDGELPAPDPHGLAYIQFSSGSTRFPRGVSVTQSALSANAAGLISSLAITDGDRTVSWLPLYHDMGLIGHVFVPLYSQMSLDLLPTGAFVRRPLLWLELISRNGGNLTYGPSFGYELCARRAETVSIDGLDLSSLKVAGIGADMIRPAPLQRFAEVFASAGFNPKAFTASYGMAEATLAISVSPKGQGLRFERVDLDRLEREDIALVATADGARSREFAYCGELLPDFELEIRDERGQVLGDRRPGRIFVRGPSLMKAYFGAPEETALVLSPEGWLDTGDLGYLLDGQIVITGRAKDMMIVNGRNIWPQDLEWSLEAGVEGVRSGDAALFSLADDEGIERIVALIQCRLREPSDRSAFREEIRRLLLARHGLEVEINLVPTHSLPQTSSGKLSRSKARDLYQAGAFDSAPMAATA